MHIFRIVCLTAVVSVSLGATPLVISYTSSGSGVVNGLSSFTDANFTITQVLDTASRQSMLGGFFIDATSTSIFIAGTINTSFTFVTPTRSFVNNTVVVGQNTGMVGFSRAGIDGTDLIEMNGNAAFATWNMLTPLGPFVGTGEFLQWSFPTVTVQGANQVQYTLIFGDAGGLSAANLGAAITAATPVNITFQATVGAGATPEPGSMALMGLGLAGLGLFARRAGIRPRCSQ